MWAIIGGSGFENFEGFETVEELDRQTPFGLCSSGFKKVKLGGQEVLFLSRHGASHELLPSEVNYRANIFNLKKHGATKVLAFSAVGSLREELKPGDMVVPYQFIDRTKSLRRNTFCGEGLVGHVSLAKPVTSELVQLVEKNTAAMDFDIHQGKTCVVMEGPAFSTKAESDCHRQFGGDIIGMTAFPEYALAREAGLGFLPCYFVTDYDCWDESRPHVTLEEVIGVMRANNARAFQMALALMAEGDVFNPDWAKEGLKTGLMTPQESWTPEQKQWLSVLLK